MYGPSCVGRPLAGRRRRQDIVIALWLVVYFAIVGGWLNKAVRYTLPMLPFLALFGAAMFVEAFDRLRAQKRRRASLVVVALAALTLAFGAGVVQAASPAVESCVMNEDANKCPMGKHPWLAAFLAVACILIFLSKKLGLL